ncbi:MAG: Asp-tRNA(Asn)/Glu-tRNA(Gln) amidotransferase subunit GatB [Patescibacteria group bacterium]
MYKTTIGLEIHTELKTNSKMFCGCKNDADEKEPNKNVCPICLGHPGTMPAINKKAVEKVVKTGLALNCTIPLFTKFDRKNYFYPDLPKGYQISQYDKPLCEKGYLDINGKKIGITRVHLEEDTGKLIHPEGEKYSLVDFNRAGVPLMELVTEPDIESGDEARKFAEELRLILRYLDISEANMEKGQMRIEVNISLSKNENLGTKVEIKNLNSFRSVERSIEYEIKRQRELLESGRKIIQETRGWNDSKGETFSQREKESAHDYRYFPEPDLPPIRWKQAEIDEIKSTFSELPNARRKRLKEEYKILSDETIEAFVLNKEFGDYFEKTISELSPNLDHKKLLELIKLTSNYLITDLAALLKEEEYDLKSVTPENFAEFIALIHNQTISSKVAKIILPEMLKTGSDPSHIIEERGLTQVADESDIKPIIEDLIKINQKAVSDYKKGEKNAIEFLVGQVLSKTKGKANPDVTRKIIEELLN